MLRKSLVQTLKRGSKKATLSAGSKRRAVTQLVTADMLQQVTWQRSMQRDGVVEK